MKRDRLRDELSVLEREGHISGEQRALLEARLVAAAPDADRSALFLSILSTFGAVLLGAGVLYLIGYNWDALAKGTKLALIFGLWAALHGAGWWLGEAPGRYPRVGRAFTILGVLCFGAAIGLVAQIYHLTAEYPWSILLWWALNVPLLLLTRSRALQIVLTLLFLVWVHLHAGAWLDSLRNSRNADEFQAMFLVGAGLTPFFAALAALAARSRWKEFAGLWSGLAPQGLMVASFALAFHDAWTWLEPERPATAVLPFAWVAGAAVLVAGVALSRGMPRDAALEIGAGFAGGLVLAAAIYGGSTVLAITGNALSLAIVLGLVVQGLRRRHTWRVNLGIAYFALLVVSRYLEYLWDKLQGAYAFLGTGALILGLAWFLERRRRAILDRVREAPTSA